MTLIVAGLAAADVSSECRTAGKKPGSCELYAVSLVRLLSHPDLYDGKRVIVKGFVRLEFEGQGIFLSKEDDEYLITRNGLWLAPRYDFKFSKSLSGRYCSVIGRFSAQKRGHLSAWGGSLVEVEAMAPLSRRSHLTGDQQDAEVGE